MTMKDPRDKKYYELLKKSRTTLSNLSPEELRTYLSYAEQMIDFVSDKVSRKGWIARKKDIMTLLYP
jgi:hypothetical protein